MTQHLPIPTEALSQHIADVGTVGSGKTYAAKVLVEHLLEQRRRVCIIDPTGVWWGLRSSADGQSAGFPIVVFGGEHGDVPISELSGERLAELIAARNMPCVIDMSEFGSGERHRFMTAFAGTLHKFNRQPLHLVIDEADEFMPQNPMPESKRMLHELDRIVRRGRVKGFRVMMITQRPAVLHKNVLTQAGTLMAMRLSAPQDRKAIEEWVKGHGDVDQAKEVLGSLSRLQRGEGWVWSPLYGVLERVKFPLIRTFDSSRTPEDGGEIAEPTALAPVEVAELRAMLAPTDTVLISPPSKEAGKNDTAALDTARDEGYRAGIEEGRRQRSAEDAETIRKLYAAMEAAADYLLPIIKAPPGETTIIDVRRVPDPPTIEHAQPPNPSLNSRATVSLPQGGAAYKASRRNLAEKQSVGALPGPQQRILDALAWWENVGIDAPTRLQVAVVARYSPDGGAFQNPLGSLRTSGMIEYPAPGVVSLTTAGRKAARRPERPATTDDLHHMAMSLLDGPKQRILQPLLCAYPRSLSRESLAQAAGYEPNGGAFQNPLGALRSLGFIDYPQRGMVKAEPVLFLQARG